MRNIVIPGARIMLTVVITLTAPSVPDVPVRMIDDDPQVGAEPGEPAGPDSGG